MEPTVWQKIPSKQDETFFSVSKPLSDRFNGCKVKQSTSQANYAYSRYQNLFLQHKPIKDDSQF